MQELTIFCSRSAKWLHYRYTYSIIILWLTYTNKVFVYEKKNMLYIYLSKLFATTDTTYYSSCNYHSLRMYTLIKASFYTVYGAVYNLKANTKFKIYSK